MTEFQISSNAIGKNTMVLILTYWLDLGEGRTPRDPLWETHVKPYVPGICLRFEKGSIKAAYEGSIFNEEQPLDMRDR